MILEIPPGTMDVKALLDMLPFNGAKTVIGGVASILFGIGGLVLGKMDYTTAVGFIIAGWTALGIAHKGAKAEAPSA